MCEMTTTCPFCHHTLTPAEETACSVSSMGARVAYRCPRCGAAVSLTASLPEPTTIPFNA